MTNDPPPLAVLLMRVAQELDEIGYPSTGVIRRGAGELLKLSPIPEDACDVCGGEVVQTGRGRPRVHCSARCRKTQWRRNAKVTKVNENGDRHDT